MHAGSAGVFSQTVEPRIEKLKDERESYDTREATAGESVAPHHHHQLQQQSRNQFKRNSLKRRETTIAESTIDKLIPNEQKLKSNQQDALQNNLKFKRSNTSVADKQNGSSNNNGIRSTVVSKLFRKKTLRDGTVIGGGTSTEGGIKRKNTRRMATLVDAANIPKQNPYTEFTLDDLKVIEEAIKNNREDLEKELLEIQNRKKNLARISLQPTIAKKWDKVRNSLMAFTMMRKIFTDIKQYGTSMQALTISNNVIEKCRNLLEMRKEERTRRKWMFYPDSQFLFLWSLLMFLIYLLTATYSPFKLFFMEDATREVDTIEAIDRGFGLLLFINILIRMNSVVVDSEGNVIDNRMSIAKRYAKHPLIWDILMIFPFELLGLAYPSLNEQMIVTGDYDEVFRVLRMPFLMNSIRIDQQLFEYFKVQTTIQRLLRFVFAVCLSVHIVGCLWVFIARANYGESKTWIEDANLDVTDSTRVYLFAIYWTLQTLATVGFGDVHASNETEVIFSILWMVIGAGFFSFAVGQLSKMFTSSESRSQKLQNSTHIMDEFCEQAGLNIRMKESIRKALQYSTDKSILSSSEKEDFFDSIPMKLKTNLAEGLFKGAITIVPFLRNKDSFFLANLLPMLQPLKLIKGEYVYKKDSFPNLIYFMIDGRVNFLIGSQEMSFKSYLPGSYFGEIEIFHQCLRLFSVRCQENSEFLTLERDYLGTLMDKFPNVESEMFEMVQERQSRIDDSLQKIHKLLSISENDAFWKKQQDNQTFAEIIQAARLQGYGFTPQTMVTSSKSKNQINFTDDQDDYDLAAGGSERFILDRKHVTGKAKQDGLNRNMIPGKKHSSKLISQIQQQQQELSEEQIEQLQSGVENSPRYDLVPHPTRSDTMSSFLNEEDQDEEQPLSKDIIRNTESSSNPKISHKSQKKNNKNNNLTLQVNRILNEASRSSSNNNEINEAVLDKSNNSLIRNNSLLLASELSPNEKKHNNNNNNNNQSAASLTSVNSYSAFKRRESIVFDFKGEIVNATGTGTGTTTTTTMHQNGGLLIPGGSSSISATKNQVVLNVFNENKQPMLFEVYEEQQQTPMNQENSNYTNEQLQFIPLTMSGEVSQLNSMYASVPLQQQQQLLLTHQSSSQQTANNQSTQQYQSNGIVKPNRLAITEKYQVSTLDRIDEHISQQSINLISSPEFSATPSRRIVSQNASVATATTQGFLKPNFENGLAVSLENSQSGQRSKNEFEGEDQNESNSGRSMVQQQQQQRASRRSNTNFVRLQQPIIPNAQARRLSQQHLAVPSIWSSQTDSPKAKQPEEKNNIKKSLHHHHQQTSTAQNQSPQSTPHNQLRIEKAKRVGTPPKNQQKLSINTSINPFDQIRQNFSEVMLQNSQQQSMSTLMSTSQQQQFMLSSSGNLQNRPSKLSTRALNAVKILDSSPEHSPKKFDKFNKKKIFRLHLEQQENEEEEEEESGAGNNQPKTSIGLNEIEKYKQPTTQISQMIKHSHSMSPKQMQKQQQLISRRTKKNFTEMVPRKPRNRSQEQLLQESQQLSQKPTQITESTKARVINNINNTSNSSGATPKINKINESSNSTQENEGNNPSYQGKSSMESSKQPRSRIVPRKSKNREISLRIEGQEEVLVDSEDNRQQRVNSSSKKKSRHHHHNYQHSNSQGRSDNNNSQSIGNDHKMLQSNQLSGYSMSLQDMKPKQQSYSDTKRSMYSRTKLNRVSDSRSNSQNDLENSSQQVVLFQPTQSVISNSSSFRISEMIKKVGGGGEGGGTTSRRGIGRSGSGITMGQDGEETTSNYLRSNNNANTSQIPSLANLNNNNQNSSDSEEQMRMKQRQSNREMYSRAEGKRYSESAHPLLRGLTNAFVQMYSDQMMHEATDNDEQLMKSKRHVHKITNNKHAHGSFDSEELKRIRRERMLAKNEGAKSSQFDDRFRLLKQLGTFQIPATLESPQSSFRTFSNLPSARAINVPNAHHAVSGFLLQAPSSDRGIVMPTEKYNLKRPNHEELEVSEKKRSHRKVGISNQTSVDSETTAQLSNSSQRKHSHSKNANNNMKKSRMGEKQAKTEQDIIHVNKKKKKKKKKQRVSMPLKANQKKNYDDAEGDEELETHASEQREIELLSKENEELMKSLSLANQRNSELAGISSNISSQLNELMQQYEEVLKFAVKVQDEVTRTQSVNQILQQQQQQFAQKQLLLEQQRKSLLWSKQMHFSGIKRDAPATSHAATILTMNNKTENLGSRNEQIGNDSDSILEDELIIGSSSLSSSSSVKMMMTSNLLQLRSKRNNNDSQQRKLMIKENQQGIKDRFSFLNDQLFGERQQSLEHDESNTNNNNNKNDG